VSLLLRPKMWDLLHYVCCFFIISHPQHLVHIFTCLGVWLLVLAAFSIEVFRVVYFVLLVLTMSLLAYTKFYVYPLLLSHGYVRTQ
jgi:hypothetical protein